MINSLGASIDGKNQFEQSDARDIVLPNHRSNSHYIAVDIGGTLAKIVYYLPVEGKGGLGGRLNFAKFQTDDEEQWLSFIKQLLVSCPSNNEIALSATGGGAHLYFDKLNEIITPKSFLQLDEMDCLINGIDYFINEIPNEVFIYNPEFDNAMEFVPKEDISYPYMLVNIGSGVSIILVTAPNEYKRVSGTSLGGGTFWGLVTLLTGVRSFDEMLELSKKGTNSNVDMLVGDIYGKQYTKIGLKASAIASSMGKVYRKNLLDSEAKLTNPPTFKEEDIIVSLLYMVSNNIGQIAYLNALEHKVNHIYFGGYFIRGHDVTMNSLKYAIQFWSKGNMTARFLRHEGYLGAMGCLLKLQDEQP
ncbi:fumble [Neoconidiobolus thromboides FSU 785]|nr:fumble [Neoconidiobolus thromboides FSU 785]